MPSRLKELMVRDLKREFEGVDACVFVHFSGLSGRKAADLRHRLNAACGENAALSVVKTSMFRLAAADLDPLKPVAGDDGASCLDGPTMVAFGADDPVQMVRTLADWNKQPGNAGALSFKGAVLWGELLGPERVGDLAAIPPKPVLMGQVVGTIAAPLSGAVQVGARLLQKLVGVADALAKKTDEEKSG
jgi:large subunit ribosomal protein L10